MTQKQQKQLVQLIIVAIGLLIYFAINWFSRDVQHQPTQPTTTKQAQKQNNSNVKVNKSAVNFDYDFVMSNDPIGSNKNANTDYYMLALSWSPAFCHNQQEKYGKNLPQSALMQCGTQQKYGWVIHGLWPQNANAQSTIDHPRFCQGDLPAVDYTIMQKYLAESPSLNLLQGEWEKHGACAFDSAEQYFKKQQDLYRSLVLPTEQMNKKELFRWIKQHNPALKNAYLGASRTELFICYDLTWQVIDCK
ncbi:ribonuclease [Lonepinella koalarum]|uniref:Ribonuclease T2 n=1 Tax=Lonepinella koalarum TaxID=53417 RepID=A0A4R1KRG1_9PAST|nr:ribonuclease [Lonepinella koalarum]MDH2925692.1 ribonuclease [Lonepinella koalarum]TCK67110.1 ribonuclease T2 [Lonepinella koalarum]TFJ88901.1 ribonuclease [Lonepinella koalarum]TYG34944.1 ribonuclease [Lonepinella koalarum]